MQPLRLIDKYLNKITMYRLLVYGLFALLIIAIILSLTNRLPLDWLAIVISSLVILTATLIADKALPVIFDAPSNKDSSLITALILCCILPPSVHPHFLAFSALGALIAVASKYFITVRHKHLFNPAAFAAVVLGLTSWLPAIWWIGSPWLLPFTIIFGALVLRKIRRFQLFGVFLVASLIVTIIVGLHNSETISYVLSTAFRSSPLIFLGSVMLTEPSTTPPRLKQQYIYGLIVGALFTSQLHFGRLSATPELALIIGNIYAYIVSPKFKLSLVFKKKTELGPGLYDFMFTGAERLSFTPGQYLEWTLGTEHADSRGNRRTFSIASAPNEDEIHIAIRVPEHTSKFKTALLALEPGKIITAGQLSGDFVLPKDFKQKVTLIAGGIGITPYVSMAQTMVKLKEHRDITLFYMITTPQDFCYQDLWAKAAEFGLKVVPVLGDASAPGAVAWTGLTGRLNEGVLKTSDSDYQKRRYYISGPPGLVDAYRRLLRSLSVSPRNIVTDHFSGY